MYTGTGTALLLVAAPLAAAAPQPAPQLGGIINDVRCLAVNAVVNVLNRQVPSATPFCSSFLGIRTSTISTSTTTILPAVTITQTTVTGTDTVIPPESTVTTVVSTAVTSTVRTCTANPTQGEQVKRQATGLPPALSNFQRAQISTACSCLRIPTPSTTVTSTATSSPTSTAIVSVADTTTLEASTTTVSSTVTEFAATTIQDCSPPSATCGNQGVEFAGYVNDNRNAASGYPNFDPAAVKTQSPLVQGTTNRIGGLAQCTSENPYAYPLYGTTAPRCAFLSLNHRGYLYIAVPGTYTFRFSNIDDAAYLWLGSNAQAGFTRDNADMRASYLFNSNGQSTGTGSASITRSYLTSGDYIPLRVVFGNGQGGTGLGLTVTDPNGLVIVDSSQQSSAYLFQRGCEGLPPGYAQPFGAEI